MSAGHECTLSGKTKGIPQTDSSNYHNTSGGRINSICFMIKSDMKIVVYFSYFAQFMAETLHGFGMDFYTNYDLINRCRGQIVKQKIMFR